MRALGCRCVEDGCPELLIVCDDPDELIDLGPLLCPVCGGVLETLGVYRIGGVIALDEPLASQDDYYS